MPATKYSITSCQFLGIGKFNVVFEKSYESAKSSSFYTLRHKTYTYPINVEESNL